METKFICEIRFIDIYTNYSTEPISIYNVTSKVKLKIVSSSFLENLFYSLIKVYFYSYKTNYIKLFSALVYKIKSVLINFKYLYFYIQRLFEMKIPIFIKKDTNTIVY